MKAKLIKNVIGEYHLIVDECPPFVSITEPIINGFVIASVCHEETDFLKLSLKNCQAIERGYDLDDIFKKEIANGKLHPNDGAKKEGIARGIELALEILGDRRFTEEDMRNAMDRVWEWYNDEEDVECSSIKDLKNKHIQSLQQNEWDVTVVTKNSRTGKIIKSESELEWDEDGLCDRAVPIFDADGRLILKRV